MRGCGTVPLKYHAWQVGFAIAGLAGHGPAGDEIEEFDRISDVLDWTVERGIFPPPVQRGDSRRLG